MKAAINGFRYNSERSIIIGHYETPIKKTDYGYWSATLYKTPQGTRYFLVGSGMNMTRFATASGKHIWDKGEALTPLSADAAREWAEAYLSPEVFRKEFGI